MRLTHFYLLLAMVISSCKPTTTNDLAANTPIQVTLDLVNVIDDKVLVEIDPGRFTTETLTFYIPKTVPGTYSADNYGKYIESFKAINYNGDELSFTKKDENTWLINNATSLDKITYLVNDTYDNELQQEDPVFSPAGTNILKNQQFMLNLHGFVGYFDGFTNSNYNLLVKHPKNLKGSTTLTKMATPQNLINSTYNVDAYFGKRYFDVIDNPIMYAEADAASFMVNDIEVNINVYSPNKVYTAQKLKSGMEKMMNAQKAFLGEVNATKKYNILLYLSALDSLDARGFGALEHHTSTVVVLPESMPLEALNKTMIDVVSHEFFHIVTPLTIHSQEIHNFNYNNPKMSKHLWMYEGVTEYFANLFQIQQGLISEEEFYERMTGKIDASKAYDDAMSFTEMSEKVLQQPYEKNYANVYQKGALIGMCLDLIIREQSNGEKGILWLMKQLSQRYGVDKAFNDDEIIDEIVSLTNTEVAQFFSTHVVGNTPINYETYFAKAGLKFAEESVETGYFLDGQNPFINADETTKEVFFRADVPQNSFFTALGVQGNDVIKSINGTNYNLDNIRDMIIGSFNWKEGDDFTMTVVRDDKEIILTGKLSKPTLLKKSLIADESNPETSKLREAWLKG